MNAVTRLRRLGLAKHALRHTNSGVAILDQVVVSGTRFATAWMVARFCGTEQLGLYALAFTVYVLVDLFQQALVSSPYVVFSQSRSNLWRKFYTGASAVQAFLIGGLAWAILSVAGLVLAIMGHGSHAALCGAVGLTVFLGVGREFCRRQSLAQGRVWLALQIDAAAAVLQLLSLGVLLNQGILEATSAYLAVSLSCGMTCVWWYLAVRHQIRFAPKQWRSSWRRNWRFGRWVCITQIINQLSWNAAQWMVALLLSTASTGVFAGCLTVVFLSNPLILGVGNILLPRLAHTRTEQGEVAMQRHAVRAAILMAALLVPFSLAMATVGETLCIWIYEDAAYQGVNPTLLFLSLAITCLAVTMPLDACLWARQFTNLSSFASAIGMLVALISILFLVTWGLPGVAFGLLLGAIAESAGRIYWFCGSQTASSPFLNRHFSGGRSLA